MKSTATAAPVANPFMKSACRMIFRLLAIVCLTILSHRTDAAEPAPSTISASDLAARLSAWQQDGSSYVRLRMVVSEPAGKSAFQIQIKARRSKTGTDVVADDFGFNNATKAKQVDLKDLVDIDELPNHFAVGGSK